MYLSKSLFISAIALALACPGGNATPIPDAGKCAPQPTSPVSVPPSQPPVYSATPTTTSVAPSSSPVYSASGSPSSPTEPSPTGGPGGYPPAQDITAEQLTSALGQFQKCNPKFVTECAKFEDAAKGFNAAFAKYGITDRAEKVAVIALTAFESGAFSFNINHFPDPGRPGQGTRAMLMYNFVYKYANELYPDKVKELGADENTSDDKVKNAVRELVLNNDDSFGSSSWYLATQAKEYHGTGKIKDGDLESFKTYCTTAVGASWDEQRGKMWSALDKEIK